MANIKTLAELEEGLSQPTDADAAAMSALNGDLLILGVGGKMGPSLARLARRAADLTGTHHRIVAVARFSNASLPAELAALGIETIACDWWQNGIAIPASWPFRLAMCIPCVPCRKAEQSSLLRSAPSVSMHSRH